MRRPAQSPHLLRGLRMGDCGNWETRSRVDNGGAVWSQVLLASDCEGELDEKDCWPCGSGDCGSFRGCGRFCPVQSEKEWIRRDRAGFQGWPPAKLQSGRYLAR